MLLKCVASGSSGNTYLLMSDTEMLVLDAGIRFLEVKKAIDFKVSKIVGCIVSHEHG